MPDPTVGGTLRRRFRDGLAGDYWFSRYPPMPGTTVIRHSDHTSPSLLYRTAFFRRHLQPRGYHYGASMIVWRRNKIVACLTVLRGFNEGDFTSDHIGCLADVHRDLLGNVVHRLQDQYNLDGEFDVLRNAWNMGQDASALVRRDGKIVAATRKAVRTISDWNGTTAQKLSREEVRLPFDLNKLCGSGARHQLIRHRIWSANISCISSKDRRNSEYVLIRFMDTRSSKNAISPARLTPTEAEVLRYIGQGKTNAEIALLRGTAKATIKNQVAGLLKKFAAKNRLHLALGYREMLDDLDAVNRTRFR